MALTPLRWTAALIGGALAASVLLMRERSVPRAPATLDAQLTARAERHGRHAQQAGYRLRVLQVLDSIERAAPTTGAGVSSVRVLRDARLPDSSRVALDSLTALALRLAGDSGRMGVDIVLTYDTLSTLRGAAVQRGTSLDYALPRGPTDRCIVLARIRDDVLAPRQLRELASEGAAERLLGVCGYYRAYGMPGVEVERWIHERGWALAAIGPHSRQQPGADLHADLRSAPALVAIMTNNTSLPFLTELTPEATACLSGADESCTHALLTRGASRRAQVWGGRIVPGQPSMTTVVNYGAGRPFGRREPYMLADMARTLGPERFAKFWTSSASVPAAFASATGEPLGSWVARWGRAQYGTPPARGAGVTAWHAVVSAALVLLALGAAMAVSARRRFV